MEIKEVGRMVQTLRTEQGITQEELCRGICSVATLSCLETGERRPDISVFHALIQRIGRSTECIYTVLTIEEFEYSEKRGNLKNAILTKNFRQAEEMLYDLGKEVNGKAQPLLRQDIYMLAALLHIQKKDEKKAEVYIHQALMETISDYEVLKTSGKNSLMALRLCEAEINLILLYIYIREKHGEDESALLESIMHYIYLKITDENFKNRELAMVFYLRAKFYRKESMWEKCYRCCEASIEAEVKNGTLAVLYQSLKLEMECLKNEISVENGELRQKQYVSINSILEEYEEGVLIKNPLFFFGSVSQKKRVVDEVIRFSRLRGEYSQEELSEGICAPETLSRIENGKRNPTVKNFQAFMKKSGVELGYYNTDFVVERFETLEKSAELDRQIILKNFTESERIAREIALEIDMNNIQNQQEIKLFCTVADYRLGRITIEEALYQIEKLLELSVKRENGKFIISVCLTNVEVSLLNQIAVYYRNMGKQKQAVEILMTLYEYLHHGKLEAPEYSQKYFMVIMNLASYLEEIGELEKSIELSEEAIRAGIKHNIGIRIGVNLISKTYVQERMGVGNCLENYRHGHTLCGLFQDVANQKVVEKHLGAEYFQ